MPACLHGAVAAAISVGKIARAVDSSQIRRDIQVKNHHAGHAFPVGQSIFVPSYSRPFCART